MLFVEQKMDDTVKFNFVEIQLFTVEYGPISKLVEVLT